MFSIFLFVSAVVSQISLLLFSNSPFLAPSFWSRKRSQFLVPHGFRLALQQLNHRNDHSSGLYFDCILSVFVSVSVYAGSLIPAVQFSEACFAPRFAAQKIKLSRNRNSGVPVTLETVGDICVAIKGFTNKQKAFENGIPSEVVLHIC
ncbi:hypothetical protein DVH24_001435 [Malus domestica]|uniref:Uncharacterized protein n=1 Tax=Malus domestica TaxID=3750 RepID=A0A498K0R8_MALDO|nr:hypothetical protein DVH24_001435 [Malus domestica]